MADTDPALTSAEVRRVASLARLELSDDQIVRYRSQLSAVLEHVRQLRAIDLRGVEPMTQPVETVNRFEEDSEGPTLPAAALMDMAPDKFEPFVRVPRVFGESSGA